jgi:hypothetical protein
MYNRIYNPFTKRFVKTDSVKGKNILNNYLSMLGGSFELNEQTQQASVHIDDNMYDTLKIMIDKITNNGDQSSNSIKAIISKQRYSYTKTDTMISFSNNNPVINKDITYKELGVSKEYKIYFIMRLRGGLPGWAHSGINIIES